MNRETEYRGKRLTVREAAKQRKPLDGTDAQALEGALQQVERELSEALVVLQDFVDKVESGRARSVDTYAKCKAVLSIHDTEER